MPLPRGLVILASLWIFLSWALCIGLRPPVAASLASYAPGIRLLMASLTVGLCVAWPLLRLSGPRERWPVLRVSMDLVALAAMTHVVMWPLRLATPWPPERLAMMDAIMFSWATLVGAVVAVAIALSDARARTIAMGVCLAVATLGLPLRLLAAGLGLEAPPPWLQGPVIAVLMLGSEPGALVQDGGWHGVGAIAVSALAAWLAAWWWLRSPGRSFATPGAHG